jgi:hypothetical protein
MWYPLMVKILHQASMRNNQLEEIKFIFKRKSKQAEIGVGEDTR